MFVKDITPGAMISFRSKNINDITLYKGTLEIPVGTYRAIQSYTDPRAYNAAVRQSDSSVPSDVTVLHYFTITIDNDSAIPITRVFAQEWIANGSLTIVNPGNTVTIRVDDPSMDSQAIVSLLASAGYSSKIIS